MIIIIVAIMCNFLLRREWPREWPQTQRIRISFQVSDIMLKWIWIEYTLQKVITQPYHLDPDSPDLSPCKWVALGCNISAKTHIWRKYWSAQLDLMNMILKMTVICFPRIIWKNLWRPIQEPIHIFDFTLCLYRFGIRVKRLESLLPFASVTENTELSELCMAERV